MHPQRPRMMTSVTDVVCVDDVGLYNQARVRRLPTSNKLTVGLAVEQACTAAAMALRPCESFRRMEPWS